MRLRDAIAYLRNLGITLRKREQEYEVKPRGTGPDQTYYTDDLDDAVETGRAMAGHATRGVN